MYRVQPTAKLEKINSRRDFGIFVGVRRMRRRRRRRRRRRMKSS